MQPELPPHGFAQRKGGFMGSLSYSTHWHDPMCLLTQEGHWGWHPCEENQQNGLDLIHHWKYFTFASTHDLKNSIRFPPRPMSVPETPDGGNTASPLCQFELRSPVLDSLILRSYNIAGWLISPTCCRNPQFKMPRFVRCRLRKKSRGAFPLIMGSVIDASLDGLVSCDHVFLVNECLNGFSRVPKLCVMLKSQPCVG
jgi:hypothetical protein